MSSNETPPSGTALALQGGGAHGAFAWGVLDALLEDGLAVDRICGVSSGALLGVVLAQGLARGGVEGGRRAMQRLWERIGRAHSTSPLSRGPLDGWLFGWDFTQMAWQSMDAASRLFTPAQLNPLGHNPLRAVVQDVLDRAALCDPAAPHVTVGVTDVQTGQAVLFGNAAITVDVLLASSCLPFVFPTVEIDGRACWDGGYSGNPPIAPLLRPTLPERLVVIRAQPMHRAGVPSSTAEIFNRIHEISTTATLEAELSALPPGVRLEDYGADVALAQLPLSSKVTMEPDVVRNLFLAGRRVGLVHAGMPAGGVA